MANNAAKKGATANAGLSNQDVPGLDIVEVGATTMASKPRIHILVITNNADGQGATQRSARQSVQSLLADSGHAISTATSKDWRTAFSGAAPEVILLDASIEDGDLSALEVCRQLKSAPEAAETPVVVLLDTTGDWKVLWDELHGAGAEEYLSDRAETVEVEARVEAMAQFARLARELRAMREQLSKQMRVDDLTQVTNRRFFFHAAHRECSRARRYRRFLSCLMVEIDYFDRINKTFGYACGEDVLRRVARIIGDWTRESDIVARFDEKKFVVLLPETGVQGAAAVHEKMQNAVDTTDFEWEGQAVPVTLSIGEAERRWDVPGAPLPVSETQDALESAADFDQDDADVAEPGGAPLTTREELAELLADADAALFVAQKGARHPAVFTEYSPGAVSILGTQ